MVIKVLSRDVFEKFISDEPYIVISITDPKSEKVKSEPTFIDMLSLQFHDVDKRISKRENCEVCKGTGKIDKWQNINDGHCYACTDKIDIKLFNKELAKQILDFVHHYALEVNLIVVHCEAGISRSAGVASALSLIYNGEDQYYFDNYLPNMLVYRKIINVAVRKGFFQN